MESSYQQYYANVEDSQGEEDYSNVAFRPPRITSQPTNLMSGPQRCQPANEEEPEFSVECFNKLNKYLIGRCIPPKRKAKSYIFATKLNILVAFFLCGFCSCPCFYFAHRWAQSVKVLNNQQDYLSARSRSWFVVCCNISGIIMIFLGDAAIITVVVFLGMRLFG